MNNGVYNSQFKDQPAITVESDEIAAQFLPQRGANLCSLIYKPLNLEFMIQRPGLQYHVARYGNDYVEQGECAGLDDMFPSIDRCFYESYPWQGTPIPDHGEVWSIPWECTPQEAALHCATHGVRFPYQLEKTISFTKPGTLHIGYKVTNLSHFDFDFLWAAHPMFKLEEKAEVRLPQGVQQIATVFCSSGDLGSYGDRFHWPVATTRSGESRDLRQMRAPQTRDAAKYYVTGKMPEGWCQLTYPHSNLTLTLSFPVEKVPYLAILANEGGWQDLYNIFLEPATASFDRLDVARLHHEFSTVKAHATYEWHLDIALSPGI